ncbi:hypothetical protein Taro_011374, partial [Colocasia esculenta]|nr:hypothetical protein [Colocasia esculenta]
MSLSPSLPRLHSSFLSSPRANISSLCPGHVAVSCGRKTQARRQPQRLKTTTYPRIRALDLDENTVVAITVGVLSVAVGIGIPIFYETQINNAYDGDEDLPFLPSWLVLRRRSGRIRNLASRVAGPVLSLELSFSLSLSLSEQCRFCTGTGSVSAVLGGGETEVSKCINCDGAGALTCTTCQGSGIQPRYLDR